MTIKKGFTLSEVMITLGILGVLAAIIIPAVMNVSPDSNKVMFKKAHSTLEKTVETLINDDVNYPSNVTGQTTDGTNVTVARGFNNTDITGTVVPAGNDKFCYLFAQQLNTVGTVTCTANQTGTFETTDGISWFITPSTFPLRADSYNTIMVDVNGNKGPNCFRGDINGIACAASVQTPDEFYLGVRYDGKILVDTTAVTTDIDGGTILTDPTRNKT